MTRGKLNIGDTKTMHYPFGNNYFNAPIENAEMDDLLHFIEKTYKLSIEAQEKKTLSCPNFCTSPKCIKLTCIVMTINSS